MKELDRHKSEKAEMVISSGSWIRGVIVVAVAAALFLIRDIFLVVLTAIVIASAIEPAAGWASRRKIPRILAILAVYIFSALVFAGLFYFLFLPLLGELSGFLVQFPDYTSSIAGNSFLGTSLSVGNIIDYLNNIFLSFSQGALSSASFLFGGALSFILIVVLSFYLSVQEDGIGTFLRIITPWSYERYIVDLWARSRQKIGLWMQGQLLLAIIIAVLVYLGLLLFRLPHALLLAVAAGIFEIVPLFGPIISAIPAVLIGFSTGGAPEALLVAGLFVIVHQFENQLIYPLVVKKVIGVPPMVSIIALLVGARLAGFLGLIIAVPLAAILMEFLSDIEKQKSARTAAFDAASQ